MKVLEINSIVGEDTLIYYRRNYTAVAKIEFFSLSVLKLKDDVISGGMTLHSSAVDFSFSV